MPHHRHNCARNHSLAGTPDTDEPPTDNLFRSLPMDVIEIIFRTLCTFDPQSWKCDMQPHTLCKVSHTWRRAVQQLSSLWCTIALTVPFFKVESHLKSVKHCLKMSKDHRLEIYIRQDFSVQLAFARMSAGANMATVQQAGGAGGARQSTVSMPGVGNLFEILYAHARRWRVFWVEIPERWFSRYGFRFSNSDADAAPASQALVTANVSKRQRIRFPQSLPSLEVLCLGGSAATQGDMSLTEIQCSIESAPNLNSLLLRRCTLGRLDLAYQHLEHLQVFQLPWEEIPPVILTCTNLKTVIVVDPLAPNRWTNPRPPDSPSSSGPTRPRKRNPLKEVSILDIASPHLLRHFLQPLDLFRLDSFTASYVRYMDSFPDVYSAWGTHLTSLTLQYPISNTQPLISLLEALPALRELRLCDLVQSTAAHVGRGRYDYHPREAKQQSRLFRGLKKSRIHYGFLNSDDERRFGTGQGLPDIFFQRFDPDHVSATSLAEFGGNAGFLPNLEIFEYEGALVVRDIGFLDSLVLRTGIRETVNPEAEGYEGYRGLKRLKKVLIVADQKDDPDVGGKLFIGIVQCQDANYAWEVSSLMALGILTLVDSNGVPWV